MKLSNKKIILGIFLVILVGLVFGLWRWSMPPIGQTNFLFLGVAGKGYAGGDLTDTIMFISVENQTAKTLVLSLPRDIWVTSLRTKLNSVYHYRGLETTKEIVSQVLGQSVDYELMVDFSVFIQMIDALGGLEVNVARSFDDDHYPIAGKEDDLCNGDSEYRCRYEDLHFEAGRQKMDGARALKYVRSRFAESEEGTDFARSQRQQNLILAVKNKILSPATIFNPRKLIQLIKVVLANVQTDIPRKKLVLFLKTALRFSPDKLTVMALDENYLVSPSLSARYDHQWVLVPKSGDWQEIQEYVKELINNY